MTRATTSITLIADDRECGPDGREFLVGVAAHLGLTFGTSKPQSSPEAEHGPPALLPLHTALCLRFVFDCSAEPDEVDEEEFAQSVLPHAMPMIAV